MRTEKPIDYVVKPNGCWECTSHAIGTHGYPVKSMDGYGQNISRYIYKLYHGRIAPGNVVMHSCDNKLCINPAHISQGTPMDNIQDKVNKGRQYMGSSHHRAVLNETKAVEVFRSRSSNKHLAEKYGVTPSTIHAVKSGKTWKQVTRNHGHI